MQPASYSQCMGESAAHLILTLETREPIELSAFVGAFTSLGNEFERFLRDEHPELRGDVKFFVKEIRKGSIEADIIPMFTAVAVPLIGQLDQVMIVEDFAKRWSARLRAFLTGNVAEQPKTKGELRDFSDAVAAIATDPDASSKLSTATFEKDTGNTKIRAAFIFDTQAGRIVQEQIMARQAELAARRNDNYERVLMVFTRPDINQSKLGRKSGELVRIEELSEKSLALMYGSELAEQRIKYEMRETSDNIFRKGFVVDVAVQAVNGNPVAYSVTGVHQVIDLE